jgi:hypothetical protein
MEVVMAVFVMSVGILGMAALFPLGLREGVQARADLKQAMFADHALNQIVAVLSQTNMTWEAWVDLATDDDGDGYGFTGTGRALQNKLPSTLKPDTSSISSDLQESIPDTWTVGAGNKRSSLSADHYWIEIKRPEELNANRFNLASGRVLGVTVRSTDTDEERCLKGGGVEAGWGKRNDPYYTEVWFNGSDPD